MAVNFVGVDRDRPDLFPATVQEYRPEDHLARFVVEIVDQLDLSHLVGAYAGTGKQPGGKPPKAPEPKDQVSLTNVESRIMLAHFY